MLEKLQLGVVVVDGSGNFIFANELAAELFKTNPDQLLQSVIFDLLSLPSNQHLSNLIKQCLHQCSPCLTEAEVFLNDGSNYWWELSLQKVQAGFMITARDLTKYKQKEIGLARANEALLSKVRELQSSNAELEHFAHVASHDLQEPLRMVDGFLQLIATECAETLNAEGREYIATAIDGASRMKQMIRDLLDYSKVGAVEEAFAEVNSGLAIQKVLQVLDPFIKETQAIIRVNQLPYILGVDSQIQRLFQNLVSNALKYRSKQTPVIEIGCFEQINYWQFFIKDNGIGIDPRFYEKIFMIFKRLHNKSKYSGTGIGLAICKKIVEKHGGNLWVESEPGKGSSFYFTISKHLS